MLMWGVPLFLMTTGALLLDPKKELTVQKLVRYLKRVVLALIVFTFIFQALECLMEGETNLFAGWLSDIVTGRSWAHVWYLYLLISIYLMLPLYQAVTKHLDDKWLLYIIGVLVLFTSIAPMLKLFGIDITAFSVPIQTIYPAYLLIGYYVFHHRFSKVASVAVLALSSAAIVALTIVACRTGDGTSFALTNDDIANYSSVFVVAQSAALFNLMLCIQKVPSRLVLDVDKCTFGIYLIHMIGLRAIMKWWQINPYEYGPMAFLLLAVIVFIISYGVAHFVRKIPKLNLL